MRKFLIAAPLLLLALAGCSGDVQTSPDQEKAFRNPSKEIPPDVQEKMAAAARARGQGGPPPGVTTGGTGQ